MAETGFLFVSGQIFQPQLTVQAFPFQFRRCAFQQCQGGGRVGQPGADLLGAQDQRHAVVDRPHTAVGRGGQDDKTALGVADARQIQRLPRQGKAVGMASHS